MVGPREIGALNLFTTANQCNVKLRACVSHLGSCIEYQAEKAAIEQTEKVACAVSTL